jgi:hypothetical protein
MMRHPALITCLFSYVETGDSAWLLSGDASGCIKLTSVSTVDYTAVPQVENNLKKTLSNITSFIAEDGRRFYAVVDEANILHGLNSKLESTATEKLPDTVETFFFHAPYLYIGLRSKAVACLYTPAFFQYG